MPDPCVASELLNGPHRAVHAFGLEPRWGVSKVDAGQPIVQRSRSAEDDSAADQKVANPLEPFCVDLTARERGVWLVQLPPARERTEVPDMLRLRRFRGNV